MTANAHRRYEIRCPVYGFIALNDWEWQIISQPAYQRLRRIRQLSWTDYVFPGAMHTRFEHSLGVMHMASLLYEFADRLGAPKGPKSQFAIVSRARARTRCSRAC
jgi:HD superfamily phosphohydrolase